MNNILSTGLSEAETAVIKQSIALFAEIESAKIYGSRAKGIYKKGSDVDIALFGKEISLTTVLRISSHLNEQTMLPYRFDILDYKSTQNTALKEHIDRVGIVIA